MPKGSIPTRSPRCSAAAAVPARQRRRRGARHDRLRRRRRAICSPACSAAAAAANPFGRGGGGSAARPGRTAAPDMTGVLEVGLREAALGARRTIRNGSGASIEVQVPPGVDTRRAPAVAGPGRRRRRRRVAQPGDLYLEIRVRPRSAAPPQRRGHRAGPAADAWPRRSWAPRSSVPTVEGQVHGHHSARDLQRRQAAAARQGDQTAGRHPRRPDPVDRRSWSPRWRPTTAKAGGWSRSWPSARSQAAPGAKFLSWRRRYVHSGPTSRHTKTGRRDIGVGDAQSLLAVRLSAA